MYKKYIELRDKKGVVDKEVSKSTGICPSTFSHWKNGRSKPKIDKLILIANYFEVPLETLIGEDE